MVSAALKYTPNFSEASSFSGALGSLASGPGGNLSTGISCDASNLYSQLSALLLIAIFMPRLKAST